MTITRADDERMLATPAEWPLRPLLPLKRRRGPGQWPELGLIHESVPLTVRIGYSTLPPSPAEFYSLPERRYESVSAMLDDGWVVD